MLRRSRLVRSVRADAATAGFALTPSQEGLLHELASTGEGVYVWGGAGRGKTWLLDAWFRALPTTAKRRVHFHRFFRELHERLFQNPGGLEAAIDELVDGVEVLYFDEFHVHDPGDATLLVPLLRGVLARDVRLVTTSNYEPEGLLPNPLWHPLFVPGIELIVDNLRVVHVAGGSDLRAPSDAATGFASGRWVVGGDERLSALGFAPPAADDVVPVEVRGRLFPVRAARDGELWLSFEQLAETPTSAIEYVEWTDAFDTWVVTGIRPFDLVGAEAQQRLINAVDVLCDSDTRLVVTSSVGRESFVDSATARPDAFRMASRLRMLGTTAG